MYKSRFALPCAPALAALALAAGCSPFPDSATTGDEGRIEFRYATQCFLNCTIDQPMAVGSEELIVIDAGQNYLVASSDEAVVTFAKDSVSCGCDRSNGNGDSDGYGPVAEDGACDTGYEKVCNTYIKASGRSDGDAKLIVGDEQGNVIDKVTVQVRVARSATFRRRDGESWTATTGVKGGLSSEVSLEVVFHDAEGRGLLTTKGTLWSVADTSIAAVNPQPGWFDWSPGSQADVHLLESGETVLRATAAGLEATLPIVISQ